MSDDEYEYDDGGYEYDDDPKAAVASTAAALGGAGAFVSTAGGVRPKTVIHPVSARFFLIPFRVHPSPAF